MDILIVDDHLLFAEGLKYLLESLEDDATIYSTYDAESTLQHVFEKGNPDIILLDVNLPGVSGYELLKTLQKRNVWSPVLMISATKAPTAMGVALANGASGFVSKSSSSDCLLAAIKTVLGGDIYMPPLHVNKPDGKIIMTTRQQQVLLLLSQGMLNKQIAFELSISANTVKAHLHDIFRTFNVSNRTAAVQHAYEKGLL